MDFLPTRVEIFMKQWLIIWEKSIVIMTVNDRKDLSVMSTIRFLFVGYFRSSKSGVRLVYRMQAGFPGLSNQQTLEGKWLLNSISNTICSRTLKPTPHLHVLSHNVLFGIRSSVTNTCLVHLDKHPVSDLLIDR
jgi:hypothetical protein